jgi:hypothetical protein
MTLSSCVSMLNCCCCWFVGWLVGWFACLFVCLLLLFCDEGIVREWQQFRILPEDTMCDSMTQLLKRLGDAPRGVAGCSSHKMYQHVVYPLVN